MLTDDGRQKKLQPKTQAAWGMKKVRGREGIRLRVERTTVPFAWDYHYFASKGPSSQGYGFSIGHVWMRELDCEEGWALNNWCFWNVVMEKTLESSLDCKEIQPVHSRNQPWVFFGRNDAKAETLVLWPPHSKSWLIGKDSDAGRDWGQEEKGTTEDEMAGWRHRLDGCEFEWTPGVGDGQGGLVCRDSRGRKVLDTTKRLNWTELTDLDSRTESPISQETPQFQANWDRSL